MRLYALVEAGDPESIDVYLCEEDAQRALAERLGVKQPYVTRLESGEVNPEIDTLVNISRSLDIEFMIDIAPVTSAKAGDEEGSREA